MPNFLVRILYFGYVSHVHRDAVTRRQGDIQNLVNGVKLATGPQQDVEATLFNWTNRPIQVLRSNRVDDLRDGEIERPQLFEIEVNMNLSAQSASDSYLAHSIYTFKAIQNRFLGKRSQLLGIQLICRHCEEHNWKLGDVKLEDCRWFDVIG